MFVDFGDASFALTLTDVGLLIAQHLNGLQAAGVWKGDSAALADAAVEALKQGWKLKATAKAKRNSRRA